MWGRMSFSRYRRGMVLSFLSRSCMSLKTRPANSATLVVSGPATLAPRVLTQRQLLPPSVQPIAEAPDDAASGKHFHIQPAIVADDVGLPFGLSALSAVSVSAISASLVWVQARQISQFEARVDANLDPKIDGSDCIIAAGGGPGNRL